MPIAKVAKETLETLTKEVAKKAPKRTTFKQVKEAEIAKAKLVDEEAVAETLEADLTEEFISTRQEDITKQQRYESGQYVKKQSEIEAKNADLEAIKVDEAEPKLIIGQ